MLIQLWHDLFGQFVAGSIDLMGTSGAFSFNYQSSNSIRIAKKKTVSLKPRKFPHPLYYLNKQFLGAKRPYRYLSSSLLPSQRPSLCQNLLLISLLELLIGSQNIACLLADVPFRLKT